MPFPLSLSTFYLFFYLCFEFFQLELLHISHLTVYSMQLYNTLSAEERAQLIDEAGKQRLTLSFYAYAKIEDPKKFRDDLFLEWNKLDALGLDFQFAFEQLALREMMLPSLSSRFRDWNLVPDF